MKSFLHTVSPGLRQRSSAIVLVLMCGAVLAGCDKDTTAGGEPGAIISVDETSFREIHEADVARFLKSEDSAEYVPTQVFATITGRVVVGGDGVSPGVIEVACKPGKLTGNDPWETTAHTRNMNAAGVYVVSWEMYSGEPWSWSRIDDSSHGAFTVVIEDACDTATLFVRLPDSRVVTKTVSELTEGAVLVDVEVSIPAKP